MLIIYILTALIVGLFAGFVIGVKIFKLNIQNETDTPSKDETQGTD